MFAPRKQSTAGSAIAALLPEERKEMTPPEQGNVIPAQTADTAAAAVRKGDLAAEGRRNAFFCAHFTDNAHLSDSHPTATGPQQPLPAKALAELHSASEPQVPPVPPRTADAEDTAASFQPPHKQDMPAAATDAALHYHPVAASPEVKLKLQQPKGVSKTPIVDEVDGGSKNTAALPLTTNGSPLPERKDPEAQAATSQAVAPVRANATSETTRKRVAAQEPSSAPIRAAGPRKRAKRTGVVKRTKPDTKTGSSITAFFKPVS